MITDVAQRWDGGRPTYRPAGETINTRLYEVAEIRTDTPARQFVETEHYSRSYPAARFRYGLYHGPQLVGVAIFSVPINDGALACLPGQGLERVELGRFVLRDEVPANGESWFLARAYDLLRAEGLTGVLSMSDPVPRCDADGNQVFPGHIGGIYQATNGTYLGRATPRTLRLLPDGSVLNARAIQKLRAGERGWRYVAALLERHGATPLAPGDDRAGWARSWVHALTRALRHPGNHRYAWALQRRDRRFLPASLPYPKLSLAA